MFKYIPPDETTAVPSLFLDDCFVGDSLDDLKRQDKTLCMHLDELDIAILEHDAVISRLTAVECSEAENIQTDWGVATYAARGTIAMYRLICDVSFSKVQDEIYRYVAAAHLFLLFRRTSLKAADLWD